MEDILSQTVDSKEDERGKRILIVDDQIFNINALELILKYKLNLNTDELCQTAKGGKEAVARII